MTENNAQKLEKLRLEIKACGLDGFIVPRTDEFQGEYVPPSAERLAWLTGFTGSAGSAVVLGDKAVVMSDGRYVAQLPRQVDDMQFEIADTGATSPGQWLATHAGRDAKIGYDPKLHTEAELTALQKHAQKKFALMPVARNPVDAVWVDRPMAPATRVDLFPDTIAGLSAADKRTMVAKTVSAVGADAVIIALPESVAWLLNIRAGDVSHVPVALSQAILYANGVVDWFIACDRVGNDIHAHLGNAVRVHEPATLPVALGKMAGKIVLADAKSTPVWFKQMLLVAGATVEHHEDPCLLPRACKTAAEQAAIIAAHVRDGAAVTKFLCWLDSEGPNGSLTELDVVAKLHEFRAADPAFRDESFDTIAGWAANGAIIHYRADADSNLKITPPGLLLLDSGGQYLDGTTDITRTIAIGEPSDEMCENYTLVLKGHIAVAMAVFEEGTTGAGIDALARSPLGSRTRGYSHGTGHGVGCYLSVHEPAANISPKGTVPFKPGMLISNEPGFYKNGEYGIRLENLILVRDASVREDTVASVREIKMLKFETVTLAPFDQRLTKPELLARNEIQWLNDYHVRVYQTLLPMLEPAEQDWLRRMTSKINYNC